MTLIRGRKDFVLFRSVKENIASRMDLCVGIKLIFCTKKKVLIIWHFTETDTISILAGDEGVPCLDGKLGWLSVFHDFRD